jgi:hypothetical protein
MKFLLISALLLAFTFTIFVQESDSVRVIYYNPHVVNRTNKAKILQTPKHAKQCNGALMSDKFGICRKTVGF